MRWATLDTSVYSVTLSVCIDVVRKQLLLGLQLGRYLGDRLVGIAWTMRRDKKAGSFLDGLNANSVLLSTRFGDEQSGFLHV